MPPSTAGTSNNDSCKKLPTISVITVCRNNEATVGDTISSVNEQTYPHVEHVFVDGASTDNTLAVINGQSLRTRRIVSEPDAGIYDALNKGISLATGAVIGFLHADDFYAHPEVLQDIANRFSKQDISAVYGDLHYVSQANTQKVIRHWQTQPFTYARLKHGWMPPHPTLYVRREWYERIGGFNTRYNIAADYFSMLQLFSHRSFTSAYIPNVLVKMRMGGASNRSIKNIIQKTREDFDALKRSGVGGIGTLLAKNLRKLRQFW